MWKSECGATLFLMNADVSISLCILADVILKTRSQVLTVQKLITTDCNVMESFYTGHGTRQSEMLSFHLTLITDFLCDLRELVLLLPTSVYRSVKWL